MTRILANAIRQSEKFSVPAKLQVQSALMSENKPIFRVALAEMLRDDSAYELVRGVLEYKEHAEHWELVGTGSDPFVPADQIGSVGIDGLIGQFSEVGWVEAVGEAGVTTVNTSTAIEDVPMPRVATDDQAVGRLGADYLLERGFGQFGFLHWPHLWWSQRRLAGFRAAIDEAGRPCDVFECQRVFPPRIREEISEWLKGLPKPVAVMAGNDQLARAAIDAAVELGLRVPDDVAVLGVDNNRWAAVMAATPLSSIELDLRQVGYNAAQLLDELMRGQATTWPTWVPPIQVVTRRSTDLVLSDDVMVRRALAFIRDHCGEGINVEDVLEAAEVSRRTLENRMKQAIGQTPQTAIFNAQIARAKKLLVNSDATMGEISRACGFKRQARLSEVFKRQTGLTPGEYRHKRRGR